MLGIKQQREAIHYSATQQRVIDLFLELLERMHKASNPMHSSLRTEEARRINTFLTYICQNPNLRHLLGWVKLIRGETRNAPHKVLIPLILDDTLMEKRIKDLAKLLPEPKPKHGSLTDPQQWRLIPGTSPFTRPAYAINTYTGNVVFGNFVYSSL